MHWLRWIGVVLIGAAFVCLFSGIIVFHASAATKHGCAWPTPSPVAGSPVVAQAKPGVILLNEILTNPQSNWNCSENGTYTPTRDSWVELYNPNSQPYDLYAAHSYLDNGPGSNPFYLPLGSAIAPYSFLVLFPQAASAYIKLVGTLRFVITGVTIDQVSVPILGGDQSYARIPDGGSWQTCTTPTIGASNASPQPTVVTTSPGGSGNPGDGKSKNGTGNTPIAYGTQPTWSNLQFPSSDATSAPGGPSQGTVTSPIQDTTPSDLPRRITLTILAILLVGSLFWCWKLFTKPQQ